jgi:uncharacterized protein (DUF433 family)
MERSKIREWIDRLTPGFAALHPGYALTPAGRFAARQGDGSLALRRQRLAGTEALEGRAMKFTRITVDPKQMGGVPCIRGLRIPVATVVAMVADGMAEEEILAAYPDLEREDLREALRYAAAAVRERELPLTIP